MAALDECEAEMIRAFEKEGWQIYEKPFLIRIPPKRHLWADVSFQNLQNHKFIIVVEIKCFTDPSLDLVEFYRALGQYELYRSLLSRLPNPLPVYLAMPLAAYQRFQQRPELLQTLDDANVNYVVVDLDKEEIVQWIP